MPKNMFNWIGTGEFVKKTETVADGFLDTIKSEEVESGPGLSLIKLVLQSLMSPRSLNYHRSLGKRELICLLLFTCNNVVSVWRGFLFLWVLGMGYVIL